MALIDPFGLFFGTKWVDRSMHLPYRTAWPLGAFLTIPPLSLPSETIKRARRCQRRARLEPYGRYLSRVSIEPWGTDPSKHLRHELPSPACFQPAINDLSVPRYSPWLSLQPGRDRTKLNRNNAWAAGFFSNPPLGCRTWRATGITIYLENDGR
jgi:hypothetical protein